MNRTSRWQNVWERKGTDAQRGTLELEHLLRMNGYDTGHGDLSVDAWTAYAQDVLEVLGAVAGHSLYEVGCGAGAFLIPIHQRGLSVAGSDYSSTLVAAASEVLSDGEFECCEAVDVPAEPQYDFVVANGVFMYFTDFDYAGAAIGALVRKARCGVAILDVPDAGYKERTLALRYQVAGGREEYEKRYDGLDHLYYKRDWFVRALRGAGAESVVIRDQCIKDYGNAAGRFNVFAQI